MRILIVEDETKIAEYLQKGLTENGFIVDISHNGEDGLHLARNHEYDLIILDIMLPKLDGFSILKKLREDNETVKVLYLTARSDVDDKVRGLELGADDYLSKPFSFSELLARVRTLLRRSNQTNSNTSITIADLHIDILKHKATRENQRIDLTPKEFALLVLLAQRRGEVLSRTFISEKIWDINFDSDTNIIDVSIRRLRQKVDDPFAKKLIHTVRGLGYTLDER